MTAAISNISFAFLSIIIAAGLMGSYTGGGSRNKKLKNFSIFFFLFALYQLLLSYFLFFDDLYIAAWSYNLAIAVDFIMMAFILSIILELFGVSDRNRNIFYPIVLMIGILVVSIQVYDLRMPILQDTGIVDWNANKLASRITSLTAFLIALFWAYGLLKNFSYLEDNYQKVKDSLLAVGGLFLGLSALTTYHSYEKTIAIFSHGTAFIGGFLIFSTLLIYRKRNDKDLKS